MSYQDTWLDGKAIAKGYRECASRYEVVRDFCSKLPTPFSVLDIGANQCYFGLRLTEDFNCSVLAFEYSAFAKRYAHVKRADKTGRLKLCNRKVSLSDVQFMSSFAQFDLILTLSLLHHVGGKFDEWIAALRRLGSNVIAELSTEDCRSKKLPEGYRVPADSIILGYCGSHIKKEVSRPLVLIEGDSV